MRGIYLNRGRREGEEAGEGEEERGFCLNRGRREGEEGEEGEEERCFYLNRSRRDADEEDEGLRYKSGVQAYGQLDWKRRCRIFLKNGDIGDFLHGVGQDASDRYEQAQ